MPGNSGGTPGQGTVQKPKNQEEYVQAMANAATDADAIAIQTAFTPLSKPEAALTFQLL